MQITLDNVGIDKIHPSFDDFIDIEWMDGLIKLR